MSKIKPSQKRKGKKPVSRPHNSMIKKCKNTIKNHTAKPSTFFNYANELNQIGDVRGALINYKKGLKRNPNDNAALINISLILIALFDFAQAIIYLTRAIIHTPDQYFAYIYRSIAFLGEGKKAEAYNDFKFVLDNYSDKIHRFTTMDKMKYPQIDFDEAMEYCLYPDAVVRPWNEAYFPTVDCPVDEICLQKEYCQQKDVCPQNDMALFRDIILRQKLGHPRNYTGETVLLDIDVEMANSVSVDLLPIPHHVSNFRKPFQYILNLKHRLTAIFSKVFLLLILPLIEILLECEAIVDI
jgi:tetratricopeptide (TPR) repeat protein